MGSDEPWDAACRRLGDRIAASPAATVPVSVSALGVRDALGSPPGPAAGAAVPVHLYGHQAVVGPAGSPALPDAASPGAGRRSGPAGCGTPWSRAPAPAPRPASLHSGPSRSPRTRSARSPPSWRRPGPAPSPRRCCCSTWRRCGSAPPRCSPTPPARAAVTPGTTARRRPGSSRDRRRSGRPARSGSGDIDDLPLPMTALVNPVTGMLGAGVVPDLASVTTSSTTGCFTLRSNSYLRETYWGGHTPSYRRSLRVGVLEGLERLAGMRPRGKRTRVLGTLDELGAGEFAALDPRTCGTYAPDFHADSEIRPFAPDREIPWVWGWSLRDGRPVLVPEVLDLLPRPRRAAGPLRAGELQRLRVRRLPGRGRLLRTDGGDRAGRVPARLVRPGPAAGDRPVLGPPGRRPGSWSTGWRCIGYTARFFDTRMTFGVPVVTAVAVRADGGLGTLCFGAGASLDPEDALAAGLCEIATDAANLRRRTERDEARLRALAADFDRVLTPARPPAALRPPGDAPARRLPARRRRRATAASGWRWPGWPRRPASRPARISARTWSGASASWRSRAST